MEEPRLELCVPPPQLGEEEVGVEDGEDEVPTREATVDEEEPGLERPGLEVESDEDLCRLRDDVRGGSLTRRETRPEIPGETGGTGTLLHHLGPRRSLSVSSDPGSASRRECSVH